MARIRTIKPSFFRSEDVSALPLRARLTWIGLWTQCDDAGRTKDNARLIKGDIWPLDDVSLRDVEEDLETLADHGRIVRYEVDGRRYLEITNWRDHQAIPKATASKLPPAPHDIHSRSRTPPVVLPDNTGTATAGKGKERKGKEGNAHARASRTPTAPDDTSSEPPTKCDQHTNNPNPPPCAACADARHNHERWQATKRARIDHAPRCRTHRGELAHNCRACAADRKAAP